LLSYMKLTRDRSDEVENTSDDAIADQLRAQSEAIESLRQAVEDAVASHLKVELSAEGESDEDDDDQLDYRMGTPSDRQLAQINKVLGRESSADDWFVCAFHASNVLLDLDLRAWDESALYQMAADAVGRPVLLDHAWSSVSSSQGFLYQALLVKDRDVDPSMLEGAGHEDYNKDIIEQNDGLLWLYLAACMPKNSEAAEAIASRKYVDSSTGTILHSPVFICPDCTRDHRRANPGSKESITFTDYKINEKGQREALCPHLIPSRFMFSWFDESELEQMNFARYAVLTSATTSKFVENSICVQGCLPKAGILTGK
jgi:hypothetical protein